MSELQKTAEQVILAGRTFKAIVDMGAHLEKLGSVEQATVDASNRLKAAQEKGAAVQAGLDALEKQHADLSAGIAALRTQHESGVTAARIAAQAENDSIITKAKSDAEDIIGSARAFAEQTARTVETHALKLQGIQDAISLAEQKHSELKAKTEKLKEAISQIG